MSRERPGYIVVEGPIGVGKTSLACRLAESFGTDLLLEGAEDNPFLERFYQDAKGELGLDDYEGRLWHGFHRHVALVMLAHCFLTLQQTGDARLALRQRTQHDRTVRNGLVARHANYSGQLPASLDYVINHKISFTAKMQRAQRFCELYSCELGSFFSIF